MKYVRAACWWTASVLLALATSSAIAQEGNLSETAHSATSSSSIKARRLANRQLQKNVRRALIHTTGIYASGIAVRASNGVVTLQGWVPEQSQIALSTQVAEGVPGVTTVISQLIVRPVNQ
ncbi:MULTISPECIES: BON domain-containing protein [Burkholderia]|uniref:Transport-associated protein n=1 Tax=Burkholderia paludis TaxID=1506587 RepID=A0A6P2L4C3_9BURK|nr:MULTISPECIES: BON domain-containing protein [Burkholderia]CAB3772638.1 hypothetical protein LMG30113_06778 [Burkholderia paludis]VWB64010.1 transport-associated protein [Burkholderia paludis]